MEDMENEIPEAPRRRRGEQVPVQAPLGAVPTTAEIAAKFKANKKVKFNQEKVIEVLRYHTRIVRNQYQLVS